MIRFSKTYLILTIILFLIEVLIALFFHDGFVRPYFGDFLVVILMYCFIKTFIRARAYPIAIGVLLFSYAIEFLQYVHIVKRLGLENSKLANIVLGNAFEWIDLVAYTLGILTVLFFEFLFTNPLHRKR